LPRFNRNVIETSGVADPVPLAHAPRVTPPLALADVLVMSRTGLAAVHGAAPAGCASTRRGTIRRAGPVVVWADRHRAHAADDGHATHAHAHDASHVC
jgi:hypothetical protein